MKQSKTKSHKVKTHFQSTNGFGDILRYHQNHSVKSSGEMVPCPESPEKPVNKTAMYPLHTCMTICTLIQKSKCISCLSYELTIVLYK